jgi:diguanylate cyclase (GGDEF)-like protein
MTAVSTFGFFSGYILEDSNRKIFLKQEALEHQASTDQLTGIYNRFKLDEILQQEIDKYYRYGRTFCIMILDIDHFKNVNDTYGHQIGDYTLVEIAKTLQNSIRSSDTLVRWGGEEFLLLCLEIDKERALKMAENIRLKIESTKIQHVGTKTVSIGVTANHTNDTIDTLTKRADTALYKAKTSGRNRVEFA